MAKQGMGRAIEDIEEESLETLGLSLDGVVDGKRYQANLKPLSSIRVVFFTPRDKIGMQATGIQHPYGIKDGAYYLVTSVRAK